MIASSEAPSRFISPLDRSLRDSQEPVTDIKELRRHSDGYHDDGNTGVRQLIDQMVDLILGTYVNTACVGSSNSGISGSTNEKRSPEDTV